MKPTTEEIVKALRRCATGEGDGCASCSILPQKNEKYGMIVGCAETLQLAAADRLEAMEKELTDERYRHDRLQDFCVAQGEELSRLKAQQRWIPVTDRLPEEWKPVLIFVTNPAGWECVTTDIFGNGVWMENCDSEWHNVTHWMPLPVPPKEENHDAIDLELVERVTHKPDAQLRPLRDMDEIKHYMGEEPKEEK